MNNIHNNNVKSANQLNTIMEREHCIKNEEHKNDSEIFAVPRPISENKSSSVFNIVGVDKVVLVSDNEIKEQDDYSSSVER
jgi:V8-like Glu-specific endopeptidase